MAKDTLLDIVQGILSEADGDEVNSISDTVESDQAARIVRDEFNTISDDFDLKTSETLKQLEATTSATPTQMTRPEGFHSIEWVRYDRKLTAGGDARYETVTYRDPDSFLALCDSRTASDTDVESYALGVSGHNLLIKNDQAPQYWTILEGYDDIIFDSYDSSLETNLQASKTLARGVQRPTLTLADASIPDLPQNLMGLLKNRARSFFWDIYKDGATPGIARKERHSEVRSQRKKYVTKKLQQERTGPNYGRKA
jgi:hypothetical protein